MVSDEQDQANNLAAKADSLVAAAASHLIIDPAYPQIYTTEAANSAIAMAHVYALLALRAQIEVRRSRQQ